MHELTLPLPEALWMTVPMVARTSLLQQLAALCHENAARRPAVLWRRGSFGSENASGGRAVERMLTVIATCRQQGRRLLDFLVAAGQATLNGTAAPSLPPAQQG